MKVAICSILDFNPYDGGVERVSVSLAEGLMEKGIDVIFVSCRKRIGSKSYSSSCPQYFLPSEEICTQSNIESLCEIITKHSIDTIINQECATCMDFLCYNVKKRMGIRLISVFHYDPDAIIKVHNTAFDNNIYNIKTNIRNCFFKLICSSPLRYIIILYHRRGFARMYEYSDSLVMLSSKYFCSLKKIANLSDISKLRYIPNMLSFDEESNVNTNIKEKIILFCARMSPAKQPHHALYAWAKIHEQLKEWRLVLVGDGDLLTPCKLLCENLRLPRVTFMGMQDPRNYYIKASIFWLTSTTEGFALTLNEAMQYGCVPLAYDSYGAVRDIIIDKKNGFIVKPNDICGLSRKTIELATDNEMRSRMASVAFRLTCRYSKNVIVDKWLNLLKEPLLVH